MTDGWVIISVPEPGVAIALEWRPGYPKPDVRAFGEAARDLVVRLYRDLMVYDGKTLEDQMEIALEQRIVEVNTGLRMKYMLTGRNAVVGEGSLQTYHA